MSCQPAHVNRGDTEAQRLNSDGLTLEAEDLGRRQVATIGSPLTQRGEL